MYLLLLITLVCGYNVTVFTAEPHHAYATIGIPGEIDLLLSYSHYFTDAFWNNEGKRLPSYNKFSQNEFSLYAEYAFNNKNSVTLNGGYTFIQESLNGDSKGIKEIELGWKHLLYETTATFFSSELIAIIPPGKIKPSAGYGKPGIQGSLLLSHGFPLFQSCAWCDLEVGYRHYQGFPSDQIRTSGAFGYPLSSHVQMIASSQLDYGLFNGNSRKKFNNIAFNANYRLLKMQIECLVWLFLRGTISLGVYSHIWGQNIGCGKGFFCGTWTDF